MYLRQKYLQLSTAFPCGNDCLVPPIASQKVRQASGAGEDAELRNRDWKPTGRLRARKYTNFPENNEMLRESEKSSLFSVRCSN